MDNIKLSFLLLLLLSLQTAFNAAFAQGLNARINTDSVVIGDSFQLQLSTDDSASPPDLSPLQKDFTLLGTSQNTSIQIINGTVSQQKTWIISLSPKTTGKLTIPVIHAGKVSSQAITINVVDTAHAPDSSGASQGINLSVRINGSSNKFYVFQEIPLTVRIEIDQPVQSAQLVAPHGDFELTPQGQDRSSQITVKGKPISIIERDYILRPQQSGTLTLAPFTLRGQVQDTNNTRRDPFADFDRQMEQAFGSRSLFGGSIFGGMNTGKPFAKRSNSLELTVQSNPNGQSNEWFLPAKQVELTAKWQPQNPTFKQGEAVTRIIRLGALGARAEQLPKLTFANVDGIKIYIDDDQTAMRDTVKGTEALRQITLSIVPTRGGELTLPEIRVPWLNIQTNQRETAVLPAQTIHVISTDNKADADNTNPTSTKNITAANNPTDGKTTTTQSVKPKTASNSWPLMVKITIAISSLLLLLGLGWWLRRRYITGTQNTGTQQQLIVTNYQQNLKAALHKALQQNDSKALYQALLNWQIATPEVKQSQPLQTLLRDLEQNLYQSADSHTALDFAAIRPIIKDEWHRLQSAKNIKNKKTLPPLYQS